MGSDDVSTSSSMKTLVSASAGLSVSMVEAHLKDQGVVVGSVMKSKTDKTSEVKWKVLNIKKLIVVLEEVRPRTVPKGKPAVRTQEVNVDKFLDEFTAGITAQQDMQHNNNE